MISPGRLGNMATTSTRSLAVLAALIVCIGWNHQLYAGAQFVKGGSVKGSIKGSEGGSIQSLKDELSLGFSGNEGIKGSSVKGSLGGTKGGAAMAKGAISSFDSKAGVASSSLSSKGFSNFAKGGFGSSSLQQGQQSTGLKGLKGSSGLKGESLKVSRLSQEFSQIKGMKGGLGGQLTKEMVKGASVGGSKGSQQSFALEGIKGGQDLFTKGATKGGSMSRILQGQQSIQVKGTKGSSSVKGVSGSHIGMKGFAKGGALDDHAQNQIKSRLGGTKGNSALKGSLKGRFPERESFGGSQSGQMSAGTKGSKGGSGASILEQETNQKSRGLLNDGAFGLDGGNVQQTSNKKGSLKGEAIGFKRRASRFGGASSEMQKTQQSSVERFGHRAQQSRFSSFGSSGILRSVHFQGPSGHLKHYSQQSFSSHRWGSRHGGFGSSKQSFSSQRRNAGETGSMFGSQQQQQRSSKGAVFRQAGKDNLQQTQQQMSQSGKNAGSFQFGSSQLAVNQLRRQGQRIQRQSASLSSFSSSSKGQQQRIGQSGQSTSLGIRDGQVAAQQAFGQKLLPASSINQKTSESTKSKLILESGLVKDLSSGATSQQKDSQRLMQSSQAAMKRPFALGSVSSESQQKSMKGLLLQQQQQQQQQRRS